MTYVTNAPNRPSGPILPPTTRIPNPAAVRKSIIVILEGAVYVKKRFTNGTPYNKLIQIKAYFYSFYRVHPSVKTTLNGVLEPGKTRNNNFILKFNIIHEKCVSRLYIVRLLYKESSVNFIYIDMVYL